MSPLQFIGGHVLLAPPIHTERVRYISEVLCIEKRGGLQRLKREGHIYILQAAVQRALRRDIPNIYQGKANQFQRMHCITMCREGDAI